MDAKEALFRLEHVGSIHPCFGKKYDEEMKKNFPLFEKEGYRSSSEESDDNYIKENYPHFVGFEECQLFNVKKMDFETYYIFEYIRYWDEELIDAINRIPKLTRRF